MKRYIYSLLFSFCSLVILADTFTQTLEDGNSFTFVKQYYGNYLRITDINDVTDTLVIPEEVVYDGTTYMVDEINIFAKEPLFLLNNCFFKALYLPKTLCKITPYLASLSSLQTISIHVAEENPRYKSKDGVLYSIDMDTLVVLPYGRTGRYDIPNGVKVIDKGAIFITFLDTLNFPETIEEISDFGFQVAPYLKTFRYPNAIRKIPSNISVVGGPALEEITFGSGMLDLSYWNLTPNDNPSLQTAYCLAPTPPSVRLVGDDLTDVIILRVPRASINLYEAHPVWGLFTRITSIEPPIVSGINEAEVTWVTNADATGYSWELYRDEERTMLLVRLYFNRYGEFSGIGLGSGLWSYSSPEPMRAAAEDADGDGEHSEETATRQFTTYYSYTIRDLSPNTQYYYTRKTYGEAGEDGEPVVIDEEQSDFTTLSDISTSLSSATDAPAVQKVLRNGSVYILNGDETYTLTGAEVK